MGRGDEAMAEIKKAQQLDPLSRRINANVGGVVLYSARRYDEAIKELERLMELQPDDYAAHVESEI